jgi:hypothetical protein
VADPTNVCAGVSALNCLAPSIPRCRNQVRALAHLTTSVHARRANSGHDLGVDIV